MTSHTNTVSTGQVLISVTLVSLVLLLSLAFQMVQVNRDREALHQVISQQDKPLEDSRKLEGQTTALALGAKKMADSGDKNGSAIIAYLAQNGISVGGPQPGTQGAAAAPAAPATQPAAADTAPASAPQP